MTHNPNEPALRATPQPYGTNSPRWSLGAGIIIGFLVAGLGWSHWGGRTGTDQTITSSTTTDTAVGASEP